MKTYKCIRVKIVLIFTLSKVVSVFMIGVEIFVINCWRIFKLYYFKNGVDYKYLVIGFNV